MTVAELRNQLSAIFSAGASRNHGSYTSVLVGDSPVQGLRLENGILYLETPADDAEVALREALQDLIDVADPAVVALWQAHPVQSAHLRDALERARIALSSKR